MSAELTTRRYSLFFSPTVLMASVILAGCGDVPQPDDMVGPRNAIVETGIADSQLQGLHLGERHFVDMATTEPSFAGLFVEAGKVVLLATNVTRSAELVGVFEAYRDELQLSQPIEVRPAAYSFVDLANWRNLALRHHSRDWIAVDLDERANRISIAVTGEDAERRIRDGLTARGVPPEVLWFEVEQPPRPGSKDVVALFDDPPPYVFSRKDRPVPAGYRITTADNGTQITECTMGFVARRKPSGQSVFATASHCTDALFSLDSTEVYQRNETASDTYLGDEIDDPDPPTGCAATFGTQWCRGTDLALFSIPADSADHGGIARPDLRGSGWPPPGGAGQYQAIDQDDPRFRIHNYLNTPAQGTTLEKVGWATGWTTGDVDSTCETRAFDNELTPLYWMVCVYEAGMYSQDGDSGGPVFAWTNQSDSVSLVGTIIGWGEGSTYFNSVGAIRDEFGEFQFEDKPLDVFIPGPWEASPNEPCTFYSNPSGGAIPYSFEWIGELTGYTQNITGTMETSGYLTVRVTDAEQNQASDSKWIDVDEFNFCVY